MRRYKLSEIADKPWFPHTLRNYMTDILQFIVVKFGIYEPVIPLIEEVMRHMKMSQIVDLCSGGSGPWSRMQVCLPGEEKAAAVILTDKYPNIPAFEKIHERSERKIDYASEAVDARNVPAHLQGMRTIFSAFHHFEPAAAKKILQDTVNSRGAIGVFEFSEKRLDKIAFAFFLPLFVFLSTLFVKPITFKRIFWINIIPIAPWIFTYDAVVSFLTTYSPEDLKELVEGINAQGYVWKIGQVPSKLRTLRITYLIGFPKNPVIVPGQLPREAVKNQVFS